MTSNTSGRLTIVHDVVDLAVRVDGGADDLLRKVIGPNVATHGNGITASLFDLVDDHVGLCLVKTGLYVSVVTAGYAWKNAYSQTTTLAPSLAKRIAALRPMP